MKKGAKKRYGFNFLVIFCLMLVSINIIDINRAGGASEKIEIWRDGSNEQLLNMSITTGNTNTDRVFYKLHGIDEKSHKWSSSDQSVLTVTERDGVPVLSGIKSGVAKLTLKVIDTDNKEYTDFAYISVYDRFSTAAGEMTKRGMMYRSARTTTDLLNERGYVPKGTEVKVLGETSEFYRVEWAEHNFNDGLSSGLGYVQKNCMKIPVADLTFDEFDVSIPENGNHSMRYEIVPKAATNVNLVWTSEDGSVASVDQVGRITAHKQGVTSILCAASEEIERGVMVSVYKKMEETNAVILNKTKINAGAYEGNDETYANKGEQCVLLGESGEYYYTKIRGENAYVKKIDVHIPVEEVYLNKSSLNMKRRECVQLKVTVLPVNASNKNIKWRSTDTRVADITNAGKVVAYGEGNCTIIAESQVGNVRAECRINVSGINDNIPFTIVSEITSVGIEQTQVLITNEKDAEWSTSDKEVITVDKNGVIKGISPGKATITAMSKIGKGKKDKKAISVPVEILSKTIKIGWKGGKKGTKLPKKYRKKRYKWEIEIVDKGLKIAHKRRRGDRKAKIKVSKSKAPNDRVLRIKMNIYKRSSKKHMADFIVNIKQKKHPKAYYRKRMKKIAKVAKMCGLKYTAFFLKRSASDNPKNYTKGQKSKIAKQIKQSFYYKRKIKEISKKIKEKKKTKGKKRKGEPNCAFEIGPSLDKIDLCLAIHGWYNYSWKAKKKNKKWILEFKLTDKYDFDKIKKRDLKDFNCVKKKIYENVIIPVVNDAIKASKYKAINEYMIYITTKEVIE